MITDEYLLATVPAAMERAQGGPEAWAAARVGLIEKFQRQEEAGHHYRACVLAHYIGILSAADAVEQLRWHTTAYQHAELAQPDDVATFLPSLLASIGASHRAAGREDDARYWYERAAAHLEALPDDDYGSNVTEQVRSQLAELNNG